MRLILSLLIVLSLGIPASAQGVKKGGWFEDTSRIGFKLRSPKGWDFTPAALADPIDIGSFAHAHHPWALLQGDRKLEVRNWLLDFDRTRLEQDREAELLELLSVRRMEEIPKGIDPAALIPEVDIDETIDGWVQENLPGERWSRVEDEPRKFGKVAGRELVFEGVLPGSSRQSGHEPVDLVAYMALIPVAEGCWLASVFNTSADEYRRERAGFRSLAGTFRKLEVDSTRSGPWDFRQERRRQIASNIENTPGWWMHETENYFLVNDSDDSAFVEKVGERLEALRAIYGEDYPANQGHTFAVDESGLTTAELTPFQRSRLAVVRICSDRSSCSAHGGIGGIVGHWSPDHEELLIHDNQQTAGRRVVMATLNREAFLQYLYYIHGDLALSPWFGGGLCDFYKGYIARTSRGQLKLTPDSRSEELARKLARADALVPLKTFVSWSQNEYCGSNDLGAKRDSNIAQSWSFVWFLRHGDGEPKGWNSDWDDILDTYLEVLSSTGNPHEANTRAFEGVDWEELEECWKAYVT